MAEKDVTIAGNSYPDVPSINVPITGGGTASYVEISDTTATDADVLAGAYFYNSQGVRTLGIAQIPTDANDVNAFSLVGLTEIPASSNLNNYLTPGNYYVGSSNASTITNSPTTSAFYMSVSKNSSGSSYIHQNLRTLYGVTYYRCMRDTGTAYSDWVQLPVAVATGTITYTAFTDTSSYVKRYGELVVLNINGKPNGSISSGTDKNIITLPSGYRPAAETRFLATRGTSGTSMVPARVATDGKVYIKPSSNMSTSDLVYGNVTFAI